MNKNRTLNNCRSCLFYVEIKEEIVNDDGTSRFPTRRCCKLFWSNDKQRYTPETRHDGEYEIAPARSGTDGWGRDWCNRAQTESRTEPACKYRFDTNELRNYVNKHGV